MKIHPLTPGLLASIAMRANHAVFIPMGLEEGMMGIGPWDTRIPEGLRYARDAYGAAQVGELHDVQILEEIDGRGFYSPEREEYYESLLSSFPGMLDLARNLADGRTKD